MAKILLKPKQSKHFQHSNENRAMIKTLGVVVGNRTFMFLHRYNITTDDVPREFSAKDNNK